MYITPHYENLTLEHEKNENDSQPTPSTSQIEIHSEKTDKTIPGEQMDLDEVGLLDLVVVFNQANLDKFIFVMMLYIFRAKERLEVWKVDKV